MEMSIFDKISLITKYVLSSFMTIEISILCLLSFVFIFLNLKFNNKKVKIATIFCLLVFALVIIIVYKPYVYTSLKMLIKSILNIIYFPSVPTYFFIMLCVTIVLIYSILSKTINKKIKILNIIVASFEYLLFILAVSIFVANNINLKSEELLYQNEYILSLIQVGNVILFFYIEIMLLYALYNFFKKKFD